VLYYGDPTYSSNDERDVEYSMTEFIRLPTAEYSRSLDQYRQSWDLKEQEIGLGREFPWDGILS
jgi:hypothetical protein